MLEQYLSDITGFDETSLQPNSGAQGEFAGLLCIQIILKVLNKARRILPLFRHRLTVRIQRVLLYVG